MNEQYKRKFRAIAVFIVLSAAAFNVTAQTVITKRIKLKARSGSTTVKGTLPAGDLTRVYVLRAAKNQRLKLRVTFTGRGDADFSLKRPDGKDVDEENIINSKWAGVLPQTGDYKINVFNPSKIRGVVKYDLIISLGQR